MKRTSDRRDFNASTHPKDRRKAPMNGLGQSANLTADMWQAARTWEDEMILRTVSHATPKEPLIPAQEHLQCDSTGESRDSGPGGGSSVNSAMP